MRRTSTQADMFSPSFHSSRRRGEISSGVFSMVGTIVGGGTLSIPWAVAKSGLALGLSLLLLSALISATAVTFLLSAARRCGGLRTYDAVLEAACGRWARTLTSWSVVATCFLTLCANQILLRQLAVPLVAEYALRRPLGHAEGLLVGAGLVSCVVPLTYMSTLNSLRHVSLCSVMTVGVLVVVLGVKGFGCSPPPSLPPVELASADVLSALPVFVVCALFSLSTSTLSTLSLSTRPLPLHPLPVQVCYLCSFSAPPHYSPSLPSLTLSVGLLPLLLLRPAS